LHECIPTGSLMLAQKTGTGVELYAMATATSDCIQTHCMSAFLLGA